VLRILSRLKPNQCDTDLKTRARWCCTCTLHATGKQQYDGCA